MFTSELDGATLGRSPHRLHGLDLACCNKLAFGELEQKIGSFCQGHFVKERVPLFRSCKPALPVLVELIFDICGELPERD